jgi:putative flippase GtrA
LVKKLYSLIRGLIQRFRQLILYGIIGASCAGLDFCIYTLLFFVGVDYLVANLIGVHCGIFCSFILNRQFNFKIKNKTVKRFFSFYIIGLIGLGISTMMLYLLVSLAGKNELYSKLSTIVIVAIIQFFLNKYITFKNRDTIIYS